MPRLSKLRSRQRSKKNFLFFVRDIVRHHRHGISLVLFLVVLAKVAWVIEPTVFGRVIDAMIRTAKTPAIGFLWPLLLWAAVFLVNSGAGTLQRVFEARVYNRMFAEIAKKIATSALNNDAPPTRAAARTELAREFVTFFQKRVPDIVEEVFDLAGTVIALSFYDWRLAIACLGIILPLAIINRVYNRHVMSLEKELHDGREGAYDIFAGKDPERVYQYYLGLSRYQERVAGWGAVNFGVIRLFLLGMFVVVLYISIDLDKFSTGKIYSVAAYVWSFVTSAEFLPDLMESRASIADISARLRSEEV